MYGQQMKTWLSARKGMPLQVPLVSVMGDGQGLTSVIFDGQRPTKVILDGQGPTRVGGTRHSFHVYKKTSFCTFYT